MIAAQAQTDAILIDQLLVYRWHGDFVAIVGSLQPESAARRAPPPPSLFDEPGEITIDHKGVSAEPAITHIHAQTSEGRGAKFAIDPSGRGDVVLIKGDEVIVGISRITDHRADGIAFHFEQLGTQHQSPDAAHIVVARDIARQLLRLPTQHDVAVVLHADLQARPTLQISLSTAMAFCLQC